MPQFYCEECFSLRVIPAARFVEAVGDERVVAIRCPECKSEARRLGVMSLKHAYELGCQDGPKIDRTLHLIYDNSNAVKEAIRKRLARPSKKRSGNALA